MPGPALRGVRAPSRPHRDVGPAPWTAAVMLPLDGKGIMMRPEALREATRQAATTHEFLCYDQALATGWPIATGIIEGAARHIIADRLDVSGARWGLDGAEAMLELRTVAANGDLDAYWRFHLALEHQHLCPACDQDRYGLMA